MMARGFRAPTGPPRPPELPDPWEFGFVVSESTVSYIPSTAQNHTTFSLVSYLDHDFLVQLFVFLGVSTIKKKKSRMTEFQFQGFTSITVNRRTWSAFCTSDE